MRLVTIQTKDVLEKMKITGVHRADINKIRYKNLKHEYEEMIDIMNKNLGTQCGHAPIWCYKMIHNEKPPLDLHHDNYKHKGTSGLNDNTVLIELEVPDNQVFLSDYYTWSDYIYFKKEDKVEANRILGFLSNLEKADTIQGTIFEITQNMVVSIHQ